MTPNQDFTLLETDEFLFDLFTQDKGGISRRLLKTDKSTFRNFLNYYSENMALKKPFPKIIVDYVNNNNLQAFARSHSDSSAIIGIYEGCHFILRDYYLRLLSYDSLFPNIGDPTSEVISKPSLRNFYTSFEELVSFGDLKDYDQYDLLVPQCPTRKVFADLLSSLAIHFIFEHELSHILNGHSLFRNAQKQPLSKEIILCLEMDADCTAYNRCINHVINIFQSPRTIDPIWRKFFTSIEDAIFNMTVAVYGYLRLSGDGHYEVKDFLEYPHSPPRVRQLSMLATGENFLKKQYSDVIVDYSSIVKKAILEIERSFKIVTGNSLNQDVFKQENYAEHPHAILLLKLWAEIRPELLKYSYRDLAPAQY